MTALALDAITVLRQGRALLRGVSLSVQPGEIVAVLGPNGAGKSTLVRVAAGELTPTTGSAWINGEPVARLPRARLARQRAVLPQASSVSFPLTVGEVVALGRSPYAQVATRRDDAAAIGRAMAQADVAQLRDRLYATLSGGEQQRVHLARVFAQLDEAGADERPKCLLLDEPTSSLDLQHQHRVLGAVRAMAARGLAVLAVLHDPNLAGRYADRVALLAHGSLAVVDTPWRALSPERLAAVFGIQAQVLVDGSGLPFVVAAGVAAAPG